jgi:hypothetical protein
VEAPRLSSSPPPPPLCCPKNNNNFEQMSIKTIFFSSHFEHAYIGLEDSETDIWWFYRKLITQNEDIWIKKAAIYEKQTNFQIIS